MKKLPKEGQGNFYKERGAELVLRESINTRIHPDNSNLPDEIESLEIPSEINPFGTPDLRQRNKRGNGYDQLTPTWAKPAELARTPKVVPKKNLIAVMHMAKTVYLDIERTIGSRPAESGGMLLSSKADYTIDGFVFDGMADKNSAVYQPNIEFLNNELKNREEHFVGIVHSHPPGYTRLSPQDLHAAWCNLTSPGNPHLNAYLMPIVQTKPDTGKFEIIPFIVTCHPEGQGKVVCTSVSLVLF
jgi:Prokaryotic homologs of the JAB domain